jgi:hypothetical protein
MATNICNIVDRYTRLRGNTPSNTTTGSRGVSPDDILNAIKRDDIDLLMATFTNPGVFSTRIWLNPLVLCALADTSDKTREIHRLALIRK